MAVESTNHQLDHLPQTETSAEKTATTKLLADSQTASIANKDQKNDSNNDATLAKQSLPSLSIVGVEAKGKVVMGKDAKGKDANESHTSATNGPASASDSPALATKDPDSADHSPASPNNQSSNDHWYSGALSVGEDLASGAKEEVVDHPGRVLESAAIGVATGVAVGLLAPEVVVAAGAVGMAYAGYKLYENAGNWINDAKVVAAPQDHSAAEQSQAKSNLQSLGGGMVDVAAGFAGFGAGSALQTAFVAGVSTADGAAETSLNAPQALEPPLEKAPVGTAEAPAIKATTNAATDSSPAIKATTDAATDSAPVGQGLGRAPEERAAVVNRLATGTIENIETSEDAGLAKPITTARVVGADGQSTDVIIRKIDTSDTLDLSRIHQAQIQATVDSLTGINSGAPESAMRQIDIDGQSKWVALQENAGKSLGANLKDWAAATYGHADEMGSVPPEDLANIVEANPALKESIGNSFLQTLYQGNPDLLNLSNLAVRGSQAGDMSLDEPMQIPIIDAKYNWFPGEDAAQGAANPTFPAPNWGQNAGYGDATPVVQLYAGKPLSEISPLFARARRGDPTGI